MRRLLLTILIIHQAVHAKDLGDRGMTFSILEEGFIQMIERRLNKLDIKKEQEKIQAKIIKQAINPKGKSVPRTKKQRSFTYDPTFVLNQDVILPDGQVVYKKGDKVNPLEVTPLDKKLIFIDGNDTGQIEWFKKQNVANEDKVILISGSPNALSKELHRPVYFDQSAEMTNKFGINQVPAVLKQEGNLLRVEECAL
jgi:conjugal transfer pilus assembly protein TraW